MTKRYVAVHKFYNFLRSNKLAPLSVKLKVLHACVTSSLLHNCEAFGPKLPKQLESTYYSLIKACLGVRISTPNKLVLIESGMPTLKSMIYSRQLNFFTKYLGNLKENTPRKDVFVSMLDSGCDFMIHYVELLNTYPHKNVIKEHFQNLLLTEFRETAQKPENYKYFIYRKFNSTRLRLRCSMPIETGRCSRIKKSFMSNL